MKFFFILVCLFFSVFSKAQVLCGTANENGSITLTAPVGNVFTSIEFASYGTPNGSCGSFTIGSCHASNSQSIAESLFLGMNSATISASNGVFGDPCSGTPKRLYIQVAYSSTLPLTLVSFFAQKTEQNKVILSWISNHEINTSHFIIERSEDGIQYQETGLVTAKGSGENTYRFTNTIAGIISTFYYRLKMVDTDARYRYSNIVLIYNHSRSVKLSVYPNPSTDFISITSSQNQKAIITGFTGQVMKNIELIHGSQLVSVASWPSGVYIIKTPEEIFKFIKK